MTWEVVVFHVSYEHTGFTELCKTSGLVLFANVTEQLTKDDEKQALRDAASHWLLSNVLGCLNCECYFMCQTVSNQVFSPQACQFFVAFLLNQSPSSSPTTTCCVGYVWSHKMQRSVPRWHSSCWTARGRPGSVNMLYYSRYACRLVVFTLPSLSGNSRDALMGFIFSFTGHPPTGIGAAVGNHGASWPWRSWVHLWGSCITSPAVSPRRPCWR